MPPEPFTAILLVPVPSTHNVCTSTALFSSGINAVPLTLTVSITFSSSLLPPVADNTPVVESIERPEPTLIPPRPDAEAIGKV